LSHPIAPDISHGLHRGESEALALALEIKADLVLLDDGDARLRASRLGLSIGGVLGVLLKARKAGDITSFRGEMERLRSEARFFISPALANQLLAAAEE
jgi:predicted nucleic acid-binding protein